MMELLQTLKRQGVELWFEGDRLRFRGPKGSLSPEQRAELSGRRAEVVAHMRAEAAAREQVHSLSFSQRALWFLHQQAPESTTYNIAMPARILGPVDVRALSQAVQALVDRHAILRTTYDLTEEGPVQRVAGAAAVDFEVQAVEPGLDDAGLRRRVEADFNRPFDLAAGPVFRASLFTRGPEDHVLLLAAHHIAADGWSFLMLFGELIALYAEARGGPAASLGARPLAYTEYARWQEQALAGAEGERLWSYWREKLAPPRPRLDLPSDRPRPVVQSFDGASAPLQLDAAVTQAIKDLARREGATPFVVLLAAYQAFLSGLTGAQDVIVGTPAFARSKAEFIGVVGDFVNSLPIRAHIDPAMSFRALVAQLRGTMMEALDAQEYPLPLLVQRLQPERSAAESPLFNTFFILQRFDQFREFEALLVGDEAEPPVDFGGLRLAPYPVEQQSGQFDLSLQMAEVGGAFRGSFKYSTDLFEAATVEGFAAAYAAQTGALTRDPDAALGSLLQAPDGATADEIDRLLRRLGERDIRISLDGERLRINAPKGALDDEAKAEISAHRDEIIRALKRAPSLTADDERRLAEARTATTVEHDRTRCLHHLLETAARATPDAPAVSAGAATLSYAEVEARANRLAHLLRARGVGHDDLVAVCLPRGLDMPVALAGVLKAGAAYVPLDGSHPVERLNYTLDDAGAACVVTTAEYAPLFASRDIPAVLLDGVEAELAAQPATPPEVEVRPEDLAYVIYTSGSTGRPKGVQVEHRNMVSFLEAMRREPGLTASDTVLAVTTLSFDIAGLELWLPLSVGARAVVASGEDVVDGERLIALMDAQGVTLLQATPATWRLLIEAGWTGKAGLKALCGGEALPRDLAAQLTPRVGELWNMYGPTETTVWSTVGQVEGASGPVPIGHPIANTRVYVLDPAGAPVPFGQEGELCIAGEGVARGYKDRPELTAEKFVTVDLPGAGSERVYRTGDMARFRADGALEYLGRRDDQVKIRGYRIELGEIEAVLAAQPAVKTCVVVAREDNPGERRLVGYVVLAPGAVLDVEALRAALRVELPDYMVPGLFAQLPTLPLTPNGKIDRKALPAPKAPAPAVEALMSPVQRRVADIWRAVLSLDRVGLHQNFFDLGGHSLLLVKLHAALKREFGAELALVELFQRTTVAAQAERLSKPAGAAEALKRAQGRAERQAHA